MFNSHSIRCAVTTLAEYSRSRVLTPRELIAVERNLFDTKAFCSGHQHHA